MDSAGLLAQVEAFRASLERYLGTLPLEIRAEAVKTAERDDWFGVIDRASNYLMRTDRRRPLTTPR